ncbi:MAG: hypothetical protein LBI19_10930 [Oscillospiraceae bacterium]|jgi:hypothetical protein|nr:hypothetical protein [Oscillospiraceae bacterium]
MIGTLKRYLDGQIGEHGYVCIRRHDNAFLCEGKLGELRSVPLWELIDEENAKVKCAYSGTSESGRRCIVVKLADQRKGRKRVDDDSPPWD